MRPALKTLAILAVLALPAACASTVDELRNVNNPPQLTPIQDPSMAATGRRQVVMPMPAEPVNPRSTNSLWQPGARQFFADSRASRIGDILTVNIAINDRAQLSNQTNRTRSSDRSAGVSSFFGLENLPGRVLPEGFDPANMVGLQSEGTFSGQGGVTRQERVELTVAAVVTQVLPNGNLVVAGRQEVRVNNEVRELLVSGIVRPQDITAANTVRHTQMAEARIAYGGRGQLSAWQQPPVGERVLGIISPF
jgi:flagellar L-ring protein precursor FlgH